MLGRRDVRVVLVVLSAIVVGVLWPLASRPASHVYDPLGLGRAYPDYVAPDVHLTLWIVGWVARTLVTAPTELFAAPIFHPAPDALAYSEHMIGATPLTVPLYWLAGEVVAHQVLLVAAFVLGGIGTALLVVWWTGSAVGALVAGTIYALAPWRFRQLFAVHLQCLFYLPLVLLFAARHLTHGRRRDLVAVTVTLTGQALSAYSLAYPVFAGTVPFVIVYAIAVRAPIRRVGAALAGIVVAGLLTAAVSVPYLRVQEAALAPVAAVPGWTPEHLQRTMRASLGSWLANGGMLYPGGTSLALAAGGLILGLGGVRLVRGGGGPRALTAGLIAFAAPLVVLSLGPQVELWGSRPLEKVWEIVPGLPAFRSPLRFGFPVTVVVAALGGLAAAWMEARLRRWRASGGALAWGAALVIAGAVWGQLPARAVTARPFPSEGGTPSVYDWLARERCDRTICPVLEIPASAAPDADPRYVYWTLRHGHPILNGYSGYAPAWQPLIVSLAAQLPGGDAADALARITAVRWIVVHGAQLTDTQRSAWAEPVRGLRRAATFGSDTVFAVHRPSIDWRPLLREPPHDGTFGGVPLGPLGPGGLVGDVVIAAPPRVKGRRPVVVDVRVRNAGRRTWPALTSRPGHRVVVRLGWLGDAGTAVRIAETVHLPRDLAPGDAIRVAVPIVAPARPGHYRVTARVDQEGASPRAAGASGGARVEVVP